MCKELTKEEGIELFTKRCMEDLGKTPEEFITWYKKWRTTHYGDTSLAEDRLIMLLPFYGYGLDGEPNE